MNTYEHKKIPCWTSSMTLNMGPCVAPPAWFYGKNWLISWAKFRWNKLGQCLSLMNVTRLLVVIYPSSWKVANSRMVRIDIRKRTNTYLVLLSETSVNLGVNELRNSARHHPQSLLEVFDIFLDMNYSCVEKCWHINCIIHTMWILCCYFLIH